MRAPNRCGNLSREVELKTCLLYKLCILSGSEMRTRLILATLFGLLFCSLASLETTELFKLADDTSNDFSLLGTQREAASAIARQGSEVQPNAVPIRDGSERSTVHRRDASSSHPPKDSLHFFCIMRT